RWRGGGPPPAGLDRAGRRRPAGRPAGTRGGLRPGRRSRDRGTLEHRRVPREWRPGLLARRPVAPGAAHPGRQAESARGSTAEPPASEGTATAHLLDAQTGAELARCEPFAVKLSL